MKEWVGAAQRSNRDAGGRTSGADLGGAVGRVMREREYGRGSDIVREGRDVVGSGG